MEIGTAHNRDLCLDSPQTAGIDRPAAWPRALFGASAFIGVLALLDQAVFSGTSFLTAIMVGRTGIKEELGAYSLGFTIILGILCVQESLISLPYTVYGNRLKGRRRAEYAGGVLAHWGLMSVLAFGGLTLAASILSLGIGPPRLPPVIWAIACVVPFILLRQFGRRFAFAHLRVARALTLDVVVATIQIGCLCSLAATARLTAASAYVAIGFACAVGAVGWLATARLDFAVRGRQVPEVLRRNWLFGRWVFAGEITSIFHIYSLHWLLALILGTAATGVFAACDAVAALSNPLVMSVGNVLAPRSAQAFAEGGAAEVRRVMRRATLLLGAVMVLFSGLLLFRGGQIVTLLFGAEFAGHGPVVAVVGLSALACALGIPAGDGLRAMERPDVNFAASLLGLCVALVSASVLVFPLKVLGVACGLLAGSIVASATRCVMAFGVVVRQPDDHGSHDRENRSGVLMVAFHNPATLCPELQDLPSVATQGCPDTPNVWAREDGSRQEIPS